MAIRIIYSVLDSYPRLPTAVEDIAQLLERIGVPSDVLRGPEIRKYNNEEPAGFRQWDDQEETCQDTIKPKMNKLAR